MAVNYAYNYAFVDPAMGYMCMEVRSTTVELPTGLQESGEICVEIPVNDPEYVAKYYINGEWYEDAEGTIPWTSSLL